MAEFKLVIGQKDGKCVQKELKDDTAKSFIGMKIGDTFKGELLDLTGYEFQITGGSDESGFPMRKDVPGSSKKKILAVKGIGVNNKKKYRDKKKKGLRTMKGMRQRVTVAGSTISSKTSQINIKVLKAGSKPLIEAPVEAAPAEPKKEAKAKKKE